MVKSSGFTLIEITIVICIIAIIAAIAVPTMMRARMQSNEAAAIEDLRTISTAQIAYRAARGTFGAFADLIDEGTVAGGEFLKGAWEDGVAKHGYTFNMDSVTASNFICYADPEVEGATGERFFRTDASGSILYALGGRPGDGARAIE